MTYLPGSKDDPAMKAIKAQFDRDPASVSPEGRIALANAGLAPDRKSTIADGRVSGGYNAPLSELELSRMRALQSELSIRQANGTAHCMGVAKLELGDLLQRHKRTVPASATTSALKAARISNSATLAGLRAAKEAAERLEDWSEVATLMSAIAAIEAGAFDD